MNVAERPSSGIQPETSKITAGPRFSAFPTGVSLDAGGDSDHRLRTEAFENRTETPTVSAETSETEADGEVYGEYVPVWDREIPGLEPKAPVMKRSGFGKGKGKKNSDKDWTLGDLEFYLSEWRAELQKIESDETKPRRKEILKKRIEKAEAKREIELLKNKIDELRQWRHSLDKYKSALMRERADFKDLKKRGPKAIESDKALAESLRGKLDELKRKREQENEPMINEVDDAERLKLEKEFGRIQNIVARKQVAVNSSDDWEGVYDQKLNAVIAQIDQVNEEAVEVRDRYAQLAKDFPDLYKEISLIDSPRDYDPSAPIHLEMGEVEKTSSVTGIVKDSAVVTGGVVGSMIGFFAGGVKELWLAWRTKKWSWRDLVFGFGRKKK